MRNINVSLTLLLAIFVITHARKHSSTRKRRTAFVPVEPEEDCYGIQCNSPSRYPEKYIRRLLKKSNISSNTRNVFEPTEKVEMKFRSPYDEPIDNVKNVCQSKEVTAFPKTAKDEKYKLRFLVNTKQYQQGITYEICVSEEAFIDKLLLDYYFFCKQHYSTVRLLYLTEEGKLDYGQFPVPSACVCSYTKIKT
ncbi:hypothetical protein WA026_005525 [Henosepilachna vigintioctopunctata]|uniref:Spaetzle domain-containing protein n=1 Tax=Henosepilachna vigintioctopunctata TaxID=420089 RepID=A0AAW1TWL4_9CUCU